VPSRLLWSIAQVLANQLLGLKIGLVYVRLVSDTEKTIRDLQFRIDKVNDKFSDLSFQLGMQVVLIPAMHVDNYYR
jgi:uncharacterized membrane-anchored protein YhcB (DUF1043 family)